ncbi:hypothetical protein DS62_12300 [Smithella sp. SC_K08D17]|nr:hypothetical protein DS62_12300 [Smithella sp. SC_K08D17]
MRQFKLFIILSGIFCCSLSFWNKDETKFILFINDKLALEQFVSDFKIICNNDTMNVNYTLAKIEYNLRGMKPEEFYQKGQALVIFNFLDSESQEYWQFKVSLDAKELGSRYLIMKIFTKNKTNKRRFQFNESNFLYEYESPYGSHLLPTRRKKIFPQIRH